MAYKSNEYHREVREEDREKQGGWRSWFGLGDNKDRDEDRGYSYSNTTTYRNPQPSSYGYPGYGPRGGYGYSTSDEVNRGPSWYTDRDYTPRGDRDIYKPETRTYGGDRDNWVSSRPSGDYPYTPKYTPEYPSKYTPEYPSKYTPEYPSKYTPEYPSKYTPEYPSKYTPEYPSKYSGMERTPSRGYPTPTGPYGYPGEYPTGRDWTRTEYPTGRGYGFERDFPTTSRYTGGFSGDYKSGPYSCRY